MSCGIVELSVFFIDVLDLVSGQMKCPKCRQKGLDQDWEQKNSPADIMIAIESSKDLLFNVPPQSRLFSVGYVVKFNHCFCYSSILY